MMRAMPARSAVKLWNEEIIQLIIKMGSFSSKTKRIIAGNIIKHNPGFIIR
jgi:hypothetical protein